MIYFTIIVLSILLICIVFLYKKIKEQDEYNGQNRTDKTED